MAIQFARCEYVSRSSGGNACRKASYNQREAIRCERTGELFSFKERGGNVHHEVLLPTGAHEKFKNSVILWNEVEACEKRKDSQLAKEFVIALPDDASVTLEDHIELTRRFGHIFTEKGVTVQLDVHAPHDGEKNWHAHLLVTTRRFSEDGLTFYSKKATDLDPVIRGGKVVEADLWGEIWRDLQNTYFEEKGYDLRVDPIGIVPQEHLGPVRMRHHLNEAVLRSQMLQKANETLAHNPQVVLEELTRTRAVFSQKDVELFLQKHVSSEERNELLESILAHPQLIPLYNKETGKEIAYFTTRIVRAEEEKLVRFAHTIAHKPRSKLFAVSVSKGLENKSLSPEQKQAYDLCVQSGQNLSIIQGRAGVGKSYVVGAIREAHEAGGYRVLGLAPTNKVAQNLNRDGFQEANTCHSFLFRLKNGREKLDANTLVIVDEAGMLGTTLSIELFNVIKNSGAKLILVGDDRQLQSVERGGTFKFLAERYGAAELQQVRRQVIDWQKAVSEELSKGNIKDAIGLLEENKAISWNPTKEGALAALLKTWAQDNLLNPHKTRLILAQKNVDVDALNQGIRDVLRSRGQLGELEMLCSTQRGRAAFAEGDRIQFTKTDKAQDILNSTFGTIERIDPQTKIMKIQLDGGDTRDVNPNTYDGLRHGYASTVYKGQGSTLDDVYVLHSKATTKSTNYVALTRQTRSLHLYVSQDETPSQEALIRQMGRQDELGTSLFFHTQQDIAKMQEERTWSTQIKHSTEAFVKKAKDFFHANENFYRFEKPKSFSQEKAEIVSPTDPYLSQEKAEEVLGQNVALGGEKTVANKNDSQSFSTTKIFEDLTEQCKQRLYAYLKEEKRDINPDLMKRIENQAEKAANFIFHAHTLKGTQPTEKEAKHFLLRAKYELDRVSELRQELIHKWQKAGSYKGEKDELIAHMIAERQSSIEGRMYFEAKQKGLNPSSTIPNLAAHELKAHRAATEKLSKEFTQQYGLSTSAATNCAKDILRYQETHGEKPSPSQMAAMVQISRELDKQTYPPSMDSHNIEYLRRRDGDLRFREMASQGSDFSGFKDLPHKEQSYAQIQPHVKAQPVCAVEENEKGCEMGL